MGYDGTDGRGGEITNCNMGVHVDRPPFRQFASAMEGWRAGIMRYGELGIVFIIEVIIYIKDTGYINTGDHTTHIA